MNKPILIKKKVKKVTEKATHKALCGYIKYQYPDVVFTSDSSGLRLTMGLRMEIKAMRSCHTIPDLLILEPRGSFAGLALEIKKDKGGAILKDGSISTGKHIQDQHQTLLHLEKKGYKACFGQGFDHCKSIIDEYMSLPAK